MKDLERCSGCGKQYKKLKYERTYLGKPEFQPCCGRCANKAADASCSSHILALVANIKVRERELDTLYQ